MEFKSLIKDKDVLLVGNGSGIRNRGEEIDSYEFVIRFNMGIKQNVDFNIGKKCNLWVYAMKSEPLARQLLEKANIQPEFCGRYASPCQLRVGTKWLNMVQERKTADQSLLNHIILAEGQVVSTGISLLHYIVEYCEPKSLTIMGFDSFKTPNFYASRIWAGQWHNADSEASYINELVSNNQIKIV